MRTGLRLLSKLFAVDLPTPSQLLHRQLAREPIMAQATKIDGTSIAK